MNFKRPMLMLISAFMLAVLCGCQMFQEDLSKLKPSEKVALQNIYSDNMIFQRGKPMVFKGTGTPGQKVTVSVNKASEVAKVGKNGGWMVSLPAQPVGTSYTVTVAGAKPIVLKNVAVGDIWVCSGQSNMQFSVRSVFDAKKEIAAANYPEIRIFQVKRAVSPFKPKADVIGTWQVCTPESIPGFSAVGYFFGRKLNQDLKIPIGLINSSWGGTRIQPWISIDGFKSTDMFSGYVDNIKKAEEKAKAKSKKEPKSKKPKVNPVSEWLVKVEKHYAKEVQAAKSWSSPKLKDMSGWKMTSLPQSFSDIGLDIDGIVWFRKEVQIPAELAGKPITLYLGRIDDCDTTFFNGVQVGETGPNVPHHWSVSRKYTVPGLLVKPGKNVIAVRALDDYGDGGLIGPGSSMYIKGGNQKIKLNDMWAYKVEYAIDYRKLPHRPNISAASGIKSQQFPTTLYNAMIAPFTFFPVKGAIWYQGESNAGGYKEYYHLMKLLVKNWRKEWNEPNMPFYWVQLAAFYKHSPKKKMPKDFFKKLTPKDPAWAKLRESQLKATELPHTGMAVSIDIGNPIDIHPKNKQDVGARLALIAEHDTYGKDVCYSGPVYEKFKIEGNKIRLYFTHACKGLVAKGGPLKQFAIAGKDMKFVWAKAVIEGDTIVVSSDKVKNPVAVRYAWSKYPEGCNLYNHAGLPASPFRTDK